MKFCILPFLLHAQFHVQSSLKDAFALPFIKILNDAPLGFVSLKGKELKSNNSKAHSYQCSVNLPNTKEGYIDDSPKGVYCRFSLGEFDKREDAEASLINMSSLITTALQRQVLLRNADSSEELPEVVKQTRIAYTTGNGFYNFNMFIQMVINENKGYKVLFEVKGGEPLYYNLIPRSIPLHSSYFKTGFQTISRALEKNELRACMGDIPGFECGQKKDENGNYIVQYTKYFSDEPNAFYEFNNALANIKVSLGHEYLFALLPSAGSTIKTAEFIRGVDFDLRERKHISLIFLKEAQNFFKVIIQFIP